MKAKPPTSFNDLLLQLAGGKNKRPELALSLGRKYWEVWYWQQKDYIPEKAWEDIVILAKAKGRKDISIEMLHKLARRSRLDVKMAK